MDCRLIFHRTSKGEAGQPIKDFRKIWNRAIRRAKLPAFIFHDLRRSAIRNMVRAGVDPAVAMRVSGHRTRSVFDRYNIIAEDDIRAAIAKTVAFVSTLPVERNVLDLAVNENTDSSRTVGGSGGRLTPVSDRALAASPGANGGSGWESKVLKGVTQDHSGTPGAFKSITWEHRLSPTRPGLTPSSFTLHSQPEVRRAEAKLPWPRGSRTSFRLSCRVFFEIIGDIGAVETIAAGPRIRQLSRLKKLYGSGRWRKMKGEALIRLASGEVRRAELHWYEAHGVGKRNMKFKRYLD